MSSSTCENCRSRDAVASQKQLADALERCGIGYVHKRELGAPRKIRHELRANWRLHTVFSALQTPTEDTASGTRAAPG